MKLLIVDDEPRTVNGLLKCLDYASFGIHEIRTASDGLAALAVMERFPADIVLADIGMPKMSGIELSRELRRLYPAVRIVFITGHADVDYMKSAFKAQVVDYILKPIDVQELRGVIERVTAQISTECQRTAYLREIEGRLDESLPLLREKFFSVPGDVVRTVKTIVNKHYSENISPRTIAKDVYLSPSYLCLLFKQETGQTLTSYITGVRKEEDAVFQSCRRSGGSGAR